MSAGEQQPEAAVEQEAEPRQMSERTAKAILLVVACGVMWGIVAAAPWVAYVVVGVLGTLGWQRAHIWIAGRQGSGDHTELDAAAPAELALDHDRLTRALHAVGAPHAHTSALAEHLGVSSERVREALDAAGITRSGGVRMKGRTVAVSPGVKRDDFPPLPSPDGGAPMEGVLTSNNNSNNAYELVDDDKNPVRTHVRWRD